MVASGADLDRVYGALADPTRRAILGVLARGETNVGALAHRFPLTLAAVSKHVRVLERAGLVGRTVRGREHRLRLEPAPLRDATEWLAHNRAFWEGRLVALERLLAGDRGPARRRLRTGRRPR